MGKGTCELGRPQMKAKACVKTEHLSISGYPGVRERKKEGEIALIFRYQKTRHLEERPLLSRSWGRNMIWHQPEV